MAVILDPRWGRCVAARAFWSLPLKFILPVVSEGLKVLRTPFMTMKLSRMGQPARWGADKSDDSSQDRCGRSTRGGGLGKEERAYGWATRPSQDGAPKIGYFLSSGVAPLVVGLRLSRRRLARRTSTRVPPLPPWPLPLPPPVATICGTSWTWFWARACMTWTMA